GGDDDASDHDGVNKGVRRAPEPSRVRGRLDLARARLSAAVKIDPPQRCAADEGDDERRDRRSRYGAEAGEAGADHDDRLPECKEDEGLAAFSEQIAREGPCRRLGPTQTRDVEADSGAEQINCDGERPHPLTDLREPDGA